jgi:glycosyltransferase involved in cell wall biosynthesis
MKDLAPEGSMGDQAPLVSFIIPAYNHENFITRTLDSIRADPYPRKEVIILDDGSRDRTFAAAQAWCQQNGAAWERAEVLSRPNRGVCATLNELVARTRGEFIVPIASDDELVPGSVQGRVDFLQGNPGILAVYGDSWLIDEAGATTGPSLVTYLGGNKRALADPSLIAMEVVLRWSGCGPGFMARRTCYDPALGVGWYDESLFMEDREYFLRMVAKGQLRFLDTRVARYRVLDTSMSRAKENAWKLETGMLLSEWKNRRRFRGLLRIALEGVIFHRRLRIKGGLWRNLKFLPRILVLQPLKLMLDLRCRHGARRRP